MLSKVTGNPVRSCNVPEIIIVSPVLQTLQYLGLGFRAYAGLYFYRLGFPRFIKEISCPYPSPEQSLRMERQGHPGFRFCLNGCLHSVPASHYRWHLGRGHAKSMYGCFDPFSIPGRTLWHGKFRSLPSSPKFTPAPIFTSLA